MRLEPEAECEIAGWSSDDGDVVTELVDGWNETDSDNDDDDVVPELVTPSLNRRCVVVVSKLVFLELGSREPNRRGAFIYYESAPRGSLHLHR